MNSNGLRCLIACEYSGVVRTEFEKLGWDAYSCDLLPSDIPGKHYQCDVLTILDNHWDLLVAFPPCTYLTYSGMKNWYDAGRAMKRIKAAQFFMKLYDSQIKYVCVENPRGIMDKIFRKPDQVVHPYFFGDCDLKRTCLWLKNLPKLNYQLNHDLFGSRTATDRPKPYARQLCKHTGRLKNRYFTDSFSTGSLKSGHEKSKTFPSIAKAMATTFTDFIVHNKQTAFT